MEENRTRNGNIDAIVEVLKDEYTHSTKSVIELLNNKTFDESADKKEIEVAVMTFLEWAESSVEFEIVKLKTNDWRIVEIKSPDIEQVVDYLKDKYSESDVTSGEFIIGEVLCGCMTEDEVREAVQAFLDWDESPQTFDIKKEKNGSWVITEKKRKGEKSNI